MSSSDLKERLFSSISVRTAFPSALILALLISALLFIITSLPVSQIIGLAAVLFILTFVIVYLISARLHKKRVETLYKIVKNISRKKFKDYNSSPEVVRDELDLLMQRSIRASDTVSKELTRLNKIENYRKEFIGDISHELKTPIFAIQGFIETLLNGAIHDENVNEVFLKKTMRNVNRLIYLTNDLMEISLLGVVEVISASDPEVARVEVKERGV